MAKWFRDTDGSYVRIEPERFAPYGPRTLVFYSHGTTRFSAQFPGDVATVAREQFGEDLAAAQPLPRDDDDDDDDDEDEDEDDRHRDDD